MIDSATMAEHHSPVVAPAIVRIEPERYVGVDGSIVALELTNQTRPSDRSVRVQEFVLSDIVISEDH